MYINWIKYTDMIIYIYDKKEEKIIIEKSIVID